MLIGIVDGLSIMLQLLTVVFALRLVRTTGVRLSWILISLAIFLMGVRRALALYSVITSTGAGQSTLVYELVGLTTSALMLSGVILIHPVFRSIKST